jgi:hypothetical protein
MAVTEVLQALGSWSINLRADTPKRIREALKYLGHIVVHTGPINPTVDRDSLLKSSRYTGVLREKADGDQITIGGSGMAYWLGDEDNKAEVFESPQTFNDPFHTVIAALLPDSVVAGTLNNIGQNFNGTIPAFLSPRQALNYVSTTLDAEWRVNGDASVDAGLAAHLYVTGDTEIDCLISRRSPGVDIDMKNFKGKLKADQHLRDFTTRTLLLANGDGDAVAIGSADIAPGLNPYKDLFGNSVKLTRIISESVTSTGNADARAQLQLNRFSNTSDALTMSTADFDVKGTVSVGDYAWVYDPDTGVFDLNNEVVFRGELYNPMKLRITEMSWSVTSYHSVAYRDPDGVWYDITKYIDHEDSDTTFVVGGYSRALGNSGADGGVGGSRPVPNTSVPNAPTWVTPFKQSVYQSPVNGETKAQTELVWLRPTNTDGSTIVDGSHFEIRYRTASTPIFPSTHVQMASFTHAQLAAGTHEQPITYTPGAYQYVNVPWSELSFLLQELVANMPYEAEIRAVDTGNPPNSGAWSTLTTWQTSGDTLPPAAPAAPIIVASRIAVQVKHMLGRSDGGTFNLDADLHHLEVHGEYEPLFTPSDSTLLGKVLANNGMIIGQIPAVGTVPIESVAPVYFRVIAVDNDGNKSPASSSVQASALLIDDAHISDLTATKITAGTILADIIMGNRIWSGTNGGARTQQSHLGFEAFNSANQRTFFVEAATGNVTITGKFQSGLTGRLVVINPSETTVPEIWFYVDTPIRRAYINSLGGGSNDIWLGLNSGSTSDNGTSPTGHQMTLILAPSFSMWSYNTVAGAGGPYGARRGGWMSIDTDNSYMGWNDDSVGTEWHHRIEKFGSHYFRGRFPKSDSMGGTAAVYVDQIGGSGTNQTVSYGATMLTTPNPIVDIQPTSGGPVGKYHCISSRSNTSFGVEYPAGNCDIFIWAFRAA